MVQAFHQNRGDRHIEQGRSPPDRLGKLRRRLRSTSRRMGVQKGVSRKGEQPVLPAMGGF